MVEQGDELLHSSHKIPQSSYSHSIQYLTEILPENLFKQLPQEPEILDAFARMFEREFADMETAEKIGKSINKI
jgi:hypothetical protein